MSDQHVNLSDEQREAMHAEIMANQPFYQEPQPQQAYRIAVTSVRFNKPDIITMVCQFMEGPEEGKAWEQVVNGDRESYEHIRRSVENPEDVRKAFESMADGYYADSVGGTGE